MSGLVPARTSAIILAGRRADRSEPLAVAHGVSDKCLVPVDGVPLIEHVAATLAASPWIDRIIVSINDPSLLESLPQCRALVKSKRMIALKAKGNLADSVLDAAFHAGTPVLITTADNVLLTCDAIASLVMQAHTGRADAAAAFARKDAILAAHPEGQRRFYQFRDGGYSNCNCYWIGNAKALQAADIFRSGGQFAKNPLRIAAAFGWVNLVRFRLGMGTLAEALGRISARMGLAILPVIMEDGALAIDVDNERTHRVVAEILRRRRSISLVA